MVYRDSPDGSDVELAPSSFTGPGQRTGKLCLKSLRVARSPPRNAKKCKKPLVSKYLAVHGRVHIVKQDTVVHQCKCRCNDGTCSSDTKSCTDALVLELIIPN